MSKNSTMLQRDYRTSCMIWVADAVIQNSICKTGRTCKGRLLQHLASHIKQRHDEKSKGVWLQQERFF